MVFIFTAILPEHGKMTIAVTDREPTIEEQWELLRKFVREVFWPTMISQYEEARNETRPHGSNDEDDIRGYIDGCYESDFEVDSWEVATLTPIGVK